jgi:hypothetical protein
MLCTSFTFNVSRPIGSISTIVSYVSAFHILMNIFTLRHYRQNEQLYLSLLTLIS